MTRSAPGRALAAVVEPLVGSVYFAPEAHDDAAARLTERGLLTADGTPTPEGRAAREAVEDTVDRYCRPVEDALGDDLPELVGILQPWVDALRAHAGYHPSSPQEQVLHPDVQEWMRAHGFREFGPPVAAPIPPTTGPTGATA